MDKLTAVLRVALGLIFVYAGVGKIFHPAEFAEMVMGYRLLPSVTITLVATVLPWLEVLVGVCLILGLVVRSAAGWASIFGFFFLVAKISVILRGLDVSCGCFSVDGGSSISWNDIPGNLLLFLAALWVIVKAPGSLSLDRAIFVNEEVSRETDA